jgi:processive 1,2-diacylglycerol beta-glucosyltransferase
VFAAAALSELKSRGRISVPVIGIITDYCVHPFWEDCLFTDYIVTADGLLRHSALKRGISENRLLPFGIPVRPKFLNSIPKEEARDKLGLYVDKRTILVMGGSMGYGNIQEVVEEIFEMVGETSENIQVAAICGNNAQLLKNLNRINNPNLLAVGFVGNVEEYMDAADCVITKPGGLTTTELLVKNLPAILINPIPGPEQRNMQFFCNYGGALHAGRSFSVSEALHLMFDDDDKLEQMRLALTKLAKPDAARRVCEFAIQLTASPLK